MGSVRPFQLKIGDAPGVPTPTETTIKLPIHPMVSGTPECPPISILWVIIPPGHATSLHNHEVSDEYEYIVSGTGFLDVGEEKDIPVEPEMLVFNPMGMMHQVRNTGPDTMKLLRVHVPPLVPTPLQTDLIERTRGWFVADIQEPE